MAASARAAFWGVVITGARGPKKPLTVLTQSVDRRKQPDIHWYFETANTSPENQAAVLRLVEKAPETAKRLFSITHEEGTITWWWSMLTLVAQAA